LAEFLLVMDGGQSTTLAAVADSEGRLLGGGRAGPANHINEPGGPERFRRSVTTAIEGACRAAGIEQGSIGLYFLGMSGGNARMRAEAEKLLPPERLVVVHDGVPERILFKIS